MAAPPFLELEESLRLGIDLRPDVVGLAPEGIGWIGNFEVRDEIGAVELPCAKVADERRDPASSQQPAQVPHRVLALDARPIGERRSRHDDRPEQFRPHGRQHQHCPTGLAIADDTRLLLGFRMKLDHFFEEYGFHPHNVLDRLVGHGFGCKTNEIGRMSRAHGDAEFAVCLETSDARPVTRAGVDDNEWPFRLIDLDTFGCPDPRQQVVGRLLQRASVEDQIHIELEHIRNRHFLLRVVVVAPLAHDIPEKDGTLHRVHHVLAKRSAECLHRVRHGLSGESAEG